MDCTSMKLEDNSVDIYVSFETIEHFTNQEIYLSEAKRVLDKGGLFIVSTPNLEWMERNENREKKYIS